MNFTNTFTVSVPIEQVWDYLLDAEKVAPCVPGAQLTDTVDDRHFKGTVKVKLGAVQMSYRGDLEMEPDESTRTIVLRAKGTETRGSGGASGTVTTRLTSEDGTSTTIVMESHVDVTGRVAQFGRGIMQDVANRLIKEFAGCLEAHLAAGDAEAQSASPTPVTLESGPSTASAGGTTPAEPEPSTASRTGDEAAPAPIATAASPAPSAPTPSSNPPPPPPAAVHRPAAAEIRPMELLMAVARSRLAALLRSLADRIEPKS